MHGRDAILRVRDKWLIFNIILQLWADVKYHVPTGFGFSPKASGIYPLNRFFGEIEILFIFVGCNLIGFSDDDTTMVFDIDGGGGWYGGWRG